MFRPKADKSRSSDASEDDASVSEASSVWRRPGPRSVQEAADEVSSADAEGADSLPARVSGNRWGRRVAAQAPAAAEVQETGLQEAPPRFSRSSEARKAPAAVALSAADRELLRQVRPASEWLEAAGAGSDRTESDAAERDRSGRDRSGRGRPGLDRPGHERRGDGRAEGESDTEPGADSAQRARSTYGHPKSASSGLSNSAHTHSGRTRSGYAAPDTEGSGHPGKRSRSAFGGAGAGPSFPRRNKAATSPSDRSTRTRASVPGAASSAAPDPFSDNEHPADGPSAYSRTSDRARRPPAPRGRRAGGRVRDDTDADDTLAAGDAEGTDTAVDSRSSRGPGLSLKARAVGFLSRREHSRHELARKLARYSEDPDEIATVLDSLQRDNWLSDERFATSLIHRRAGRQGASRIVQELRQHGMAPEAVSEMRDTLRATEFERAQAVWSRRYGQPPGSPAERARQQRFLAARGFEHDVVRRVVGPVVGNASVEEDDE